LTEGIEAEQKGKKQKDFLVPSPKKKQPGPDGPNALGWCGRLRGPILPLSLIDSDKLEQQSFHVRHSLEIFAPSSGYS